MSKSEPLKDCRDIKKIKEYFLNNNDLRDYVLFTIGINTALRIGDLLRLTWRDVYDFQTNQFLTHLIIQEQKTKKRNIILLNGNVQDALNRLKKDIQPIEPYNYLFQSRKKRGFPINRSRAYTIIKKAVVANNIKGNICCHSMRKTFGYHAWKKGVPPALIMEIYNHSSIDVTKRYLSIDQDDKDTVFGKMLL